jgi:protein-tyrosine-phosphatase/predicted phosphodiesterase
MRIVHISDVHFGYELRRDMVKKAVKQINELEPDLVILTGDIGLWGIHQEFRDAYETLSDLKADLMAIPGNHDARNDGLKYFKLYFGKLRKALKLDDYIIVGVDSSMPDSDDGHIGSEQREWMAEKFRKGCVNMLALHHHIVPIPHTGRNMNVLVDAAEVIETLMTHCHGGIVLAGHRHVPYSTKLLRTHIIHAGTLSSYKVLMPDNNYNILELESESITLKLRFIDLGEVEIGRFRIKHEPPESTGIYHRLSGTRKVLFVSRSNACRTKIAEAIFNEISPGNMHAVSAGTEPAKTIDATAVKILDELSIGVSKPRKLSQEMLEDADYVVSFDEEIKADEYWDIRSPENAEDCRKTAKKIEGLARELVRKILV